MAIFAMDPTEGLLKPTDPFSEKCIYIHKIEIVRCTEVNKHFCSLEAINHFVACIHYCMLQSEVTANKTVIFSPSKYTDPPVDLRLGATERDAFITDDI